MAPFQQPLYDDDSGAETEPDTPKPPRNGMRKRLSEAFGPDDSSFNSESGRPIKRVHINDDAAEKRRRRKSTRIAVVDAPVAIEGDSEEVGETSKSAKQKQPLRTVAPPVLNLPKDKMVATARYEEMMKLVTDNKINANNTWNVALIDYFSDMSLLRNTTDNSINFQRASATLDGCVKVWTSRVDSVGTEAARLASNLASGVLDEDEEAASDDEEEEGTQAKKKNRVRNTATLVKDPSMLLNKKPDLEFSVDPLFKKTCADFDEGGAHGLLMNHLNLGVGRRGGLMVVFDAGDSVGLVEQEGDDDEPEDLIDLSELRDMFLPDSGRLDELVISESLADFAFTGDHYIHEALSLYGDDTHAIEDDDDGDDPQDDTNAVFQDVNDGVPDAGDFFTGDNAIFDAPEGVPMMDHNDEFSGDFHSNGSMEPVDQSAGYVLFDPSRPADDSNAMIPMGDDMGSGMDFSLIDQSVDRNWAGPEHHKLRRPIRKTGGDTSTTSNKTKRDKKPAFRIDFLTPSTKSRKDLEAELFAPPAKGKGSSINMPGTSGAAKKSKKAKDEKRNDHRLPDDMHFSSRQLVSLFLKPRFRRATINEEGDGEVDQEFWAKAAAKDTNVTGGGGDEDEDEDGGHAVPFNTQFFQDDYGGGFDDDGDGIGEPGEQDLLASTQNQSRRIKPEMVKYAKRAKRVDVRKLKENIWKGLEITEPVPKTKEEDMDVDEITPDPSETRQFDTVITGLAKAYPPDKMSELSTSFCFICLLHLANEKGLKLENSDSSEATVDVGNIWDLKVYRDPQATL